MCKSKPCFLKKDEDNLTWTKWKEAKRLVAWLLTTSFIFQENYLGIFTFYKFARYIEGVMDRLLLRSVEKIIYILIFNARLTRFGRLP